jgi:predicted Zn-dependent protease
MVAVACLLSGCATHRPLQGVAPLPELHDVPFFPQEDYQCGPAALATVLAYSGVSVTPEQLIPQIYLPDRQGSLQAELLSATRRYDRVPYRIANTPEALLDALRTDQPVLILQNLGVTFAPLWHYAVLIGYNTDAQRFVLRSGTVARHTMSARRFTASWQRAEHWAFVVVPASAPPPGAEASRWLDAIAPFESTGNLDIAAQGYHAAVLRWPNDPHSWTALGNLHYLQSDFSDAETAYINALALSPDHWVARNNLVHALIAQGCPAHAERWIQAAGDPPTSFAPTWSRTLNQLSTTGHTECEHPDNVQRDRVISTEPGPDHFF